MAAFGVLVYFSRASPYHNPFLYLCSVRAVFIVVKKSIFQKIKIWNFHFSADDPK